MSDLVVANAQTAISSFLTAGTTYYLSLHTADPSASGTTALANEVVNAGGSSYARKAITFTISGGVATSSIAQAFTAMPSLAGPLYIGLWSVVSGAGYIWGNGTAAVTGAIPLNATINFASGAVTATIS